MRGWSVGARALAGAAALGILGVAAGTAAAQETAVPRADGYAELERLPDWSGVWNPDWSLLFSGGGRQAPAQPPSFLAPCPPWRIIQPPCSSGARPPR